MSAVLGTHRDSGDLLDAWQGDATSVIEFLRPLREQLDADGVLATVEERGVFFVHEHLRRCLAAGPDKRAESR